jgi:hypothetical protein
VTQKLFVLGLAAVLSACGGSDDDTSSTHADGGGSGGSGGSAGSAGSASGGTGGALSDAGGDATGGAAGSGGSSGSAAAGFTLKAEASGTSTDGTETVTCTLTVFYTNLVPSASGGWTADQAGEVFRIIQGAEKYEFQALIGFTGTFAPSATGVELVMNDKPDANAKPFWKELDVLKGTESSPDHYAGTWTCAPLLLNEPGFKDMQTYAPGTWTLEPTTP